MSLEVPYKLGEDWFVKSKLRRETLEISVMKQMEPYMISEKEAPNTPICSIDVYDFCSQNGDTYLYKKRK